MSGRLLASYLLLLTTVIATGCDAGPAAVDAAMIDSPALPMSRLLGRCEQDYQCPGNGGYCRSALTSGFPGGQCTGPCTDRTDCDDGSHYGLCLTLTGETQNTCFTFCRNGSDCRPGYSCQVTTTLSTGSSAGYCFPVCASDDECGAGTQCDPYTGRCVAQGMVPTTGGDTGDPCTANADCRGNDCVSESGGINGYLGGYCVSLCRIPQGFNSSTFYDCPAGDTTCTADTLPSGTCGGDQSVCIPYGANQGENDLGICLRACHGDSDCRPGYSCTQAVTLSSGASHTFTNGWCDPIDCLTAGHTCPTGTTCHMGTDANGNPIGRCG